MLSLITVDVSIGVYNPLRVPFMTDELPSEKENTQKQTENRNNLCSS